MSKPIRNWKELREIPNESATHFLLVKEDSAWLKAKEEKEYNPKKDYLKQIEHLDVYLTTHSFNKEYYQYSTEILKKCGFDVELVNCDEE